MVALCVRSIDQRPVVCNARPLLNRAYAAVERGSWIEAGCHLREAVRLYLVADCQWHGVTIPKRKIRQTPRALLQALDDAGHCDQFSLERLGEAIDIGNAAAHCQFVRPREIEGAITTMHIILDNCRYLVQPKAAGRLA